MSADRIKEIKDRLAKYPQASLGHVGTVFKSDIEFLLAKLEKAREYLFHIHNLSCDESLETLLKNKEKIKQISYEILVKEIE